MKKKESALSILQHMQCAFAYRVFPSVRVASKDDVHRLRWPAVDWPCFAPW